MNKKNINSLNCIDNFEINLVKSTSGQNHSKSKNRKTSTNSKKTASKIKDNKNLNKNKNMEKKSSRKSKNKQTKIRKRNNPYLININNSLYSNISIFNKKILFDRKNKKNLTQEK